MKQTTAAPVRAPSVKAFDRAVADLKQGLGSAVAAATAAATGYSEQAIRGVRDLTTFNEDTMAAFTQASQIFFAGSQDLIRQVARSSHSAFTETLSSIRAFASAKTSKAGLELQGSLIRASFGRVLSESSRLAQASVELTEKAWAPLVARASFAAENLAARAA